jgi:hypothetical protein
MLGHEFWFDLLVGTIVLVYTIICGSVFFKHRTKHNLAMLLGTLLFLAGIILSYFYPRALVTLVKTLGLGVAAEKALLVLIYALVIVSLTVLYYYPQIKQFLTRIKQRTRF